MTHVCVSKLTIIGSDNGLSPGRHQGIIWTNAGILLIGLWGTNFSEIALGIQIFPFKKMHLKMSSAKWRPFCLGLHVLIPCLLVLWGVTKQDIRPKRMFTSILVKPCFLSCQIVLKYLYGAQQYHCWLLWKTNYRDISDNNDILDELRTNILFCSSSHLIDLYIYICIYVCVCMYVLFICIV